MYQFKFEKRTDGYYYCNVLYNGAVIGNGVFSSVTSASEYLDRMREEYVL